MIYIASPFFNEAQLSLVGHVERLLERAQLDFYSPRSDGVLQDMSPEKRLAEGPRLFGLNVEKIRECSAVLALKEYSDSGTTWECGFAHGIDKPVFGYRDTQEPMNIMTIISLDAVIYGRRDLEEFVGAMKAGKPLTKWQTKPEARAFK